MKIAKILFLSFYLFTLPLLGQNKEKNKDDIPFDTKMQMNVQEGHYTWAQKNLFYDYKIGVASELFITSVKEYQYKIPEYLGSSTYEPKIYRDASFMMSIFNFTAEPRVNLFGNKNFAVFVKTPITAGLSLISDRDESNVSNISKKTGVFNLTVPLLFGIGTGLNSNYSNIKNTGFSLSIGFQYIRTPLLGGATSYAIKFDQSVPINESFEVRRNHTTPVVQLDYYFLTKKDKIRGFALSFSPYGQTYFKLGYTFIGGKK